MLLLLLLLPREHTRLLRGGDAEESRHERRRGHGEPNPPQRVKEIQKQNNRWTGVFLPRCETHALSGGTHVLCGGVHPSTPSRRKPLSSIESHRPRTHTRHRHHGSPLYGAGDVKIRVHSYPTVPSAPPSLRQYMGVVARSPAPPHQTYSKARDYIAVHYCHCSWPCKTNKRSTLRACSPRETTKKKANTKLPHPRSR